MTKSITKASHQDKRDKLLSLIEGNKMSLVKAAQLVGLSYIDAKQMLFIFGTPRRKALSHSRTPDSKIPNKEFKRAGRIAEKDK